MAQRFSPGACITLPARSHVALREGRFESPHDVSVLRADGAVEALATDTVYAP
ncbi:MAG: hypothetical protein IPF99_19860 [Deltaproteobacteria bacterium]|nr:hypothetical protein [Deltaproteobacteria bacterium]